VQQLCAPFFRGKGVIYIHFDLPIIFKKDMQQDDSFKKLVSHCKEYGFIYQSSEIYDGLSAVYDYGPYGSALKNNIKEYWWKSMVQMHDNIVGIDSAIFMHPKTWKASGHVDAFNDPLIDNKDSKKRYRADVLVEDYLDKLTAKMDKEVDKARKRFDDFDEAMFRATNDRVKRNQEKYDEVSERLATCMTNSDMEGLKNSDRRIGNRRSGEW
jgi:glycyl-tRNA synthetase